ncbi:dTDP-4-dehydrorhamnose reductase [Alteraurantiacibacter aquimixticola]|uniref:dTDP-4-dehydrorhamnose reductase n=1 Tax=Alteraurantiacibacter aquimixticola TaxID=2489173 RepID=A0A4T3EY42_9SPHN|nr:dTDP-4-dehydrorhamnose reductase [Alteraurantiacibacter aquimixticola]TIX48971.1 dTDP-4-dehydrorhamnose reductase [Alteraurantiacibacter aquimixticola]
MNILITGAAGQLGRALLATAPEGVHVSYVDRTDCDLTDPRAVRELVRHVSPDIVINAAAFTAVDAAESDEAAASAVNTEAVATLVAEHQGKLVHVSTDFVFDGTSSRAYRPDDPRNPLSAYGRTKAAGEDALRPGDLLVRTSWIHSAGGANFVRTMLRLMREREELAVVADQIGAPTWAPGLARTIWGLLDKNACGTFHHSDAGVASWYDFAVAIQEEALALGLLKRAIAIRPIATADYPTPATRPAFSLLDCSATRALLQDGDVHWRVNLRRMLEEEAQFG